MAFLPVAIAAVSAGSALYSASASHDAARFNAGVAANEQKNSVDQGNAAGNLQTRVGREALGRQAAAFGAAGVGYGGSSEASLNQSAINQEYDDLSTRYKGTLTAAGYGVKAGLDKAEAGSDSAQGGLMAGNALLKGMQGNYSFAPNPAVQAGVAVQPSSGLGYGT